MACWLCFNDIFGCVLVTAGMVETCLRHTLSLIAVLCSFLAVITVIFALYRMKDETLRSLLKFVAAFILLAAVANLIIHFVKVPVGRMRYRAMNSALGQSMGGFENFTPWYVMNGQPSEEVLAQFEAVYGATDRFKSFPSGHTCAAGMTDALIIVPDGLKVSNKPLRAL